MGLINHYYFFRIRSEADAGPLPRQAGAGSPRATPASSRTSRAPAILKSAPHPAAAQKFLAFLVSQAGQTVIAHSDSFEYPLVRGVAPNPELPPLSTLEPNPITPAQIGTGTDARDLLRQAGLI